MLFYCKVGTTWAFMEKMVMSMTLCLCEFWLFKKCSILSKSSICFLLSASYVYFFMFFFVTRIFIFNLVFFPRPFIVLCGFIQFINIVYSSREKENFILFLFEFMSFICQSKFFSNVDLRFVYYFVEIMEFYILF